MASEPTKQYGVAPEQSAFVPHCSQWFFTHAGVEVPAQSSLVTHSTHCCVAGSQKLCVVGQSVAVMHPTHAPLATSQIEALLSCEQSWLLVQAAWQVWSRGQQLGVVPLPQSVLVRHWTQPPERQKRSLAGHCESDVHASSPLPPRPPPSSGAPSRAASVLRDPST
jgi:hypothetical protein